MEDGLKKTLKINYEGKKKKKKVLYYSSKNNGVEDSAAIVDDDSPKKIKFYNTKRGLRTIENNEVEVPKSYIDRERKMEGYSDDELPKADIPTPSLLIEEKPIKKIKLKKRK